MAWRSRARVSASPVVKTKVKVVWSRKSWRWYRRSGLVSLEMGIFGVYRLFYWL